MIQLQPLMPYWAIILVMVPLLVLCVVLGVRRRDARIPWLRRGLMVLMIAVVALRPVTPIEGEQTHRMDADVFFVVDRTGSMNAEDYDGDKPRLDGVRADMKEIMSMTEGSRYSIIAFDSTATSQLPLTTDAGAATAWVDTLDTEPTQYSQGSNVDRPLDTLAQAVSDTRTDDPDSHVLVYLLTDGENTDGKDAESFEPLAPMVDGGGVLGYGTEKGGPMKAHGGPDDGDYISDPGGGRAVSRIDEKQLGAIADQMGVPYLHRTSPDEPIKGTMDGITLKPVPVERSTKASSFDDWYWVAAIPLAALMIWELGERTFRLPRSRERGAPRAARTGRGGPR
jgi:Ca-activated chloride channel family protein